MEIAPGVHHFNTDPFNWYVLEEAGRLTLVDAGFPGHVRVFEQGLRTLGRQLADVEAVLITHAHADHMGFADRVATAAGAPVFVHEADVPAAQRILQLPWGALFSNAWHPFMAGMLTAAVRYGVFGAARIARPRPLRDGQVLDVPGRPQVIHTPGHTAGEVSFYLATARVLIAGDSLVTRDLYTGRHGPPQLARPRLNDDHAQARRSLERLVQLGSITLLTGHGRPWHGEAAEAVALARAAAK